MVFDIESTNLRPCAAELLNVKFDVAVTARLLETVALICARTRASSADRVADASAGCSKSYSPNSWMLIAWRTSRVCALSASSSAWAAATSAA